jgi:LysR substrate binding domain
LVRIIAQRAVRLGGEDDVVASTLEGFSRDPLLTFSSDRQSLPFPVTQRFVGTSADARRRQAGGGICELHFRGLSGWRWTAANAKLARPSSNQLEMRVFGRDQSDRGLLRVTLAPTLATHLLMPDFADFARLHPEVEMKILSSDEPVNLTNREAEVAIRVVPDRNALPLNLHGLKGPELFSGVYMSRDVLAAWRARALSPIRWIVKTLIASRTRHAKVRSPPLRFRSGLRTPGRRSSRYNRGSG